MTEYVYSKHSGKKYEVLCRYGQSLWLLPEARRGPFTGAALHYTSGPKPAEGQMWRRRCGDSADPYPARAIQLVASGWVIILGPFQMHRAYRIEDFMKLYEYVGD